MGGDAISDTVRLTEDEYKRICEVIKSVIGESIINGIRIGFPVEVQDKEDLCREMGKGDPYGDVDLIVGTNDEGKRSEVINILKKSLGAIGETSLNNKECSLLTKERYQVDVMFCSLENFDFLLAFKGNNDFGALLGHLLTPFRLKWSEQGLVLKLKLEGVSNVGTAKYDFLLTKDIKKVCDFLSMPYFCLDGKTRMSTQEIFEVLTTCKLYFNNKIWRLQVHLCTELCSEL